MAAIVPRRAKDGSVSYQVKIRRQGFPPVSRSFLRRADAERFARQAEVEMDRGAFVDTGEAHRILMSELFARYRVEVAPTLRGRHAIPALRILSDRLGKWSAAGVTTKKIAEYRDWRLSCGVTGETVRKELGTLSRVFDIAIREWGIGLPGNPVRLVTKPPPSRARDRRLADGEEARLMASLARCRNPYMVPLAQLALATGMRQGELLALNWQNVDLKRRTAILPITKNGDARAVPLSSRAIEVLEALPGSPDGGRVFPISQGLVVQAWGHAVRRAGLDDLHFHDLRHEALSRMAETGRLSALELARISGHRTLQCLARYTHLRAEDLAGKLG